MPRTHRTGVDCERPLRFVCHDCDAVTYGHCNVTDAGKCTPCADRKRRLLERITHHGIVDRLGSSLWLYFLTLTAPGESDHRRWYQGKRPKHRPECSCHHTWDGVSRGEWNAAESANWNRLRTAVTRGGDVQFIGSVEVQDGKRRTDGQARGLLHRHVVVASDRPLTHAEVQAQALAAGYGCVLDLEPLQSPEKAARYIAKYVTKSAGQRQEVAWERHLVSTTTGEVITKTAPTFRTWSSSQRWGFTIKGLRDIARQQARARARYLADLAELVASDPSTSAAAAGLAPADSTSSPPP